jgi:predicted AAA+ superfamily ATPase
MKRFLLPKLVAWKDSPDRKPLILQGARQVGKTTLLQQFGREYFPQVHTFNFEENLALAEIFSVNLDPSLLVRELRFLQEKDIDVDHDLIIFDEIQACPRALTSLKYFQEKMPNLAICAAGSLLGVYLAPVSFPVGKVDILHLYPMSFEEFLLAQQDYKSLEVLRDFSENQIEIPRFAHDHLWEQLKYYFIVGGLPEVVSAFIERKDNVFVAFQKVREKQKALITTYLADIAKHSGPVNAMHIARIFESVPALLSKSQDGSAHKYIFKGAVPGIDRYSKLVGALDWLEKAGLTIKVSIVNSGQLPFSAYAEDNVFKLYIFDVGLLGSMSQITPKVILDYDWGSYKGFFVENFVAQSFLVGGKEKLYSWQEKTAEVEFLHEKNGSVIPIEVKSGWVKQAKSVKIFADKYHSPYYVLFNAEHPLHKDRMRRYPLYLAERISEL